MSRPKKAAAPMGRPKIGTSLCITLTPEQRLWLEGVVAPNGGSLASAVRGLINEAMTKEPTARRAS